MYTDTKLSHRFIRFELLDECQDTGREMIDEYIRKFIPLINIGSLYLEETGTLHHRVQNDEDIKNAEGKVVSHARGKKGKYFTINIVCNPQNNMEPPIITNESQEEIEVRIGSPYSKNSIGLMLLIKADTMYSDPQESKLCKWANMFYEKMNKYVAENIKFFELRPFAYLKDL